MIWLIRQINKFIYCWTFLLQHDYSQARQTRSNQVNWSIASPWRMCSAGKSVVQIYYSGSFIMLRSCCKHCCHYADTLCCGSLPQRVTKHTDILSGWLISHQRSYGRGYCSETHVNGHRLSLKLVKYWVRNTTSSGLHIQIPIKDDSFNTISKALRKFFCSWFLELRVFKALRLWTVECFYS